MTAKEREQEIASWYGFGISKEKLIGKLYWELRAEGWETYQINERYLGVIGEGQYQLIKSKKENRWIVKEY